MENAKFAELIKSLCEEFIKSNNPNENFSQIMKEVQELRRDLSEVKAMLGAAPGKPEPEKPVEPETPVEPKPETPVEEPKPEEPTERLAVTLNSFNGGDWSKGVWVKDDTPRVSVADSSQNRKAFAVGAEVTLADNKPRKVVKQEVVGTSISVDLSGDKLNPDIVGSPKQIETGKPTGEPVPDTPAPEPKPDVPKPPSGNGNLPAAGLNLGGIGNNPWLAAINGPDNVRGNTHYSVTREAHIACYAKALNGKPWIARLPIAGEYMITKNFEQPNQRYVSDILGVMDIVHKYGGKVLLDMHDYYRWWKKVPSPVAGRTNKSHNDHLAKGTAVWTVINEPDCPISNEGLADLWVKIVQGPIGKHPAMFMCGLMNEPHNRGDDKVDINSKWPVAAQLCINKIREVNKELWITVGGNFYSSAKLWTKVSNNLASIKDPADKLIFEAHQYMDKGGDGGGQWASHSDPVSADQGTKDWAAFFKWCEDNNVRGMCGEVGGPATAGQYLEAVRRLRNEFIKRRMPIVFWMGGTGQSDGYANGMNTAAGVLKPNAAPLMEVMGTTYADYGPKK